MKECIKCGGETVKRRLFPCNCLVCLDCGYVEFYATEDDLKKFRKEQP